MDQENKPGLDEIARAVMARRQGGRRLLVAIAAPPGAGKSTLAAGLVARINADAGQDLAVVMPMDGFHLDNAVLDARGLLARKGAPQTFDAAGFVALVRRLQHEDEVVIPHFDRGRDLSVAGAGVIGAAQRIVLVEGNYLLLRATPWDALAAMWDFSLWLDVPLPELESRLIRRWQDHGLAPEAARARALGNDIPNARLVIDGSRPADMVVVQT
ncbi:MAG: nucleoside triphosphate hydrolase [Paracoccaceae bacterium]|nr:nucleoside triphosphate hydrolase [Paracoccaceae bacterium]